MALARRRCYSIERLLRGVQISLALPFSTSLSPLLAVPHSTPSQPLKLRFLLVLLLLRLPLPRSSTSSSSVSSSCRRCSQHRHSHARARSYTHTHRIAISLSGGRAAGLPSPSFPPTVSRDPTTSSPSTPWSQGGDPPSLRLLAPLRLPAASAKRAGWRWQAFARLYVYPCLSRLFSSLARSSLCPGEESPPP